MDTTIQDFRKNLERLRRATRCLELELQPSVYDSYSIYFDTFVADCENFLDRCESILDSCEETGVNISKNKV